MRFMVAASRLTDKRKCIVPDLSGTKLCVWGSCGAWVGHGQQNGKGAEVLKGKEGPPVVVTSSQELEVSDI